MFSLSRAVRSAVACAHAARRAVAAAALPAAPVASMSTRAGKVPTFNGFYFSKAEGSLNMRVIHPKYATTSNNFFVLKQQGRIVFDIAPSSASGDTRNYDWHKKVGFTMNAQELAQLASSPFTAPLRFAHSYEDTTGATRQAILSISPADAEAGGRVYIFSVTHTATATEPERTHSLTLLVADISLMKHMLSQSLIWITGWMLNLDPTAYDADVHLLQVPADGASRKPAPARTA